MYIENGIKHKSKEIQIHILHEYCHLHRPFYYHMTFWIVRPWRVLGATDAVPCRKMYERQKHISHARPLCEDVGRTLESFRHEG